MADRFFSLDPIVDGHAMLKDDQAHHLSKVMRAKTGDEIILFDGVGNEHAAIVREISKKAVSLEVVSSQQHADDPTPIHIAVALPKGDRQKFLVEKLVELGATTLIPLATERGVAVANEKAIERIQKQVIEATKQCRRAYLMKVESPTTIEGLIEKFASPDSAKWIADPYVEQSLVPAANESAIVAVGPEGGFTDTEIATLESATWKRACISRNVLRIETAAIAAVAVLKNV